MEPIKQIFENFPKTLLDYSIRLNLFSERFDTEHASDMDVLEESATFFVLNYLLADLRKGRYRNDIVHAGHAWLSHCETVDKYGVGMVIIGNTIRNAILKLVKIFNKEVDKKAITNSDLTAAKKAACTFMIASGISNASIEHRAAGAYIST